MNLLKKKVTKESLFSEYVKIINGVLQLSTRETEVFSFLLYEDSNGVTNNINAIEIRSKLTKELGISEANLSRYLTVLKGKGLMIRGQTGKWVINDMIRPVIKNNTLELKFVLEF